MRSIVLLRHIHRRSYSKPAENTPEDVSAIAARVAAILDEKLANSTASQLENDPSLKSQLEALRERNAAQQKAFDNTNQIALKRVDENNERLLAGNKHARDLANTRPWTGTETTVDANLRMIVDSKPKPLRVQSQGKRIMNARESSLDYKLGVGMEETKTKDDTTDESDNFKEMYKERLLGPSMLINSNPQSAFGMIGSIADARIAELINKSTGHFEDHKMSDVRGKPLSSDYLQNCTDLNFFMTKIMQNQEVLPPWVENRKLLDGDITRFREDLDKANLSNSSLVAYLKTKLENLNKQIRNYNLLAPSASLHMFKLLWAKEIDSRAERLRNKPKDLNSTSAKSQTNKPETEPPGDSIWTSIKGIFK